MGFLTECEVSGPIKWYSGWGPKSCIQCGRKIFEGDDFWRYSNLMGKVVEPFCSKGCATAALNAETGGRGEEKSSNDDFVGGGGSYDDAILASQAEAEVQRAEARAQKARAEAIKAEEEQIEAAEERRKKAANKQALSEIKNFEFSDDDNEFANDVIKITSDYAECSSAFFSDLDYKKAYTDRIEKELKFLKGNNQERYNKLLSAWNEEKENMKQKQTKRLTICGVVALAGGFLFGIGGCSNGIFSGIGAFFGGMFFVGIGAFLWIGTDMFHHSKSESV